MLTILKGYFNSKLQHARKNFSFSSRFVSFCNSAVLRCLRGAPFFARWLNLISIFNQTTFDGCISEILTAVHHRCKRTPPSAVSAFKYYEFVKSKQTKMLHFSAFFVFGDEKVLSFFCKKKPEFVQTNRKGKRKPLSKSLRERTWKC